MRFAGFLVVCAAILLLGAAVAVWPTSPFWSFGAFLSGAGLIVFVALFDDGEGE